MDHRKPLVVVREVEQQPDFLHREVRGFGHPHAVGRHNEDHVAHDVVSEDDHAKPAEIGHGADLIGAVIVGAGSGVLHAELGVEAELEDLGAAWCVDAGVVLHEGGSVAVDHGVKIFGDGIEPDEIVYG